MIDLSDCPVTKNGMAFLESGGNAQEWLASLSGDELEQLYMERVTIAQMIVKWALDVFEKSVAQYAHIIEALASCLPEKEEK